MADKNIKHMIPPIEDHRVTTDPVTREPLWYEDEWPASKAVPISPDEGNILEQKDNGIYAAACKTVPVSPDEGNRLEQKENGLYAGQCDSVPLSPDEGNILAQKDNGLYASACDTVPVSPDEGNLLEQKDNGLYVSAQPRRILRTVTADADVQTNEWIQVELADTDANINLNLPDDPENGDTIIVQDVKYLCSDTNTITIKGNGKGIGDDEPGDPDSLILTIPGIMLTLIYNTRLASWDICYTKMYADFDLEASEGSNPGSAIVNISAEEQWAGFYDDIDDRRRVYCKTITCSSLPDSTELKLDHEIDSLRNVVEIKTMLTDNSAAPVYGHLPVIMPGETRTGVFAAADKIVIQTEGDMTNCSARVTLYYTKD